MNWSLCRLARRRVHTSLGFPGVMIEIMPKIMTRDINARIFYVVVVNETKSIRGLMHEVFERSITHADDSSLSMSHASLSRFSPRHAFMLAQLLNVHAWLFEQD